MEFNTTGLKPLDASGLTPTPSPDFDVRGLKPLDTTGLRSVEPSPTPVFPPVATPEISPPRKSPIPPTPTVPQDEGYQPPHFDLDNVGVSVDLTHAIELPKGIPAGAINMVGSSLKGLAGLAQEGSQEAREIRDILLRSRHIDDAGFAQLAQRAVKNLPHTQARQVVEAIDAIREGGEGTIAPSFGEGQPVQDSPFYGAGDIVQEFASHVLPPAKGAENSAWRKLGEAGGTLAAGAAVSAIGGPVVAGTFFGLAGSGEAVERAVDAGATEEQILASAKAGLIPGLTDSVPIEMLLQRFKIPLPAIGETLKVISRIGMQAFVEGGQEVVQEILQNRIARENYNPDQSLTEGLPESAAIGGTLGGIAGTVGEMIAGRRGGRAGTNQDDGTIPPGDLGGIPEGAQPAEQVVGSESDYVVPEQVADIEPEAAPVVDEPLEALISLDDLLADERPADEIRAELESSAPADINPPGDLAPGEINLAPITDETVNDLGTRENPVQIENPEDVHVAAERTGDPTPAQAEAGNYPKRRVDWQGFKISVETEQGATRSGTGRDGVPWSVTMPVPYGDFTGTKGADGDPVDVSIGPDPQSPSVFVIDQIDVDNSAFDEHKIMIGFPDRQSASATYQQGFSDGRGAERIGAISEIPVEELRQWLSADRITKPFAYAEPVNAGMTDEQFSELRHIIFNSKLSLNPAVLAKKINVPIPSIKKVLGRLYGSGPASGLTRTQSGKYMRSAKLGPLDIVQYIASRGGIAPDENGDVLGADLHLVFIPRFGKLVRPSGNDFNTIREMLEEGGYNILDGDIMAAIRENIAGNKLYSLHDQQEVADREHTRQLKEEKDQLDRVRGEIASIADEFGTRLRDGEVDEMLVMIVNNGVGIEEAFEEIVEKNSLADEAEYGQTDNQETADHGNDTRAANAPGEENAPQGFDEPENDAGTAQGNATLGPQSVDVEQDGREESQVEDQLAPQSVEPEKDDRLQAQPELGPTFGDPQGEFSQHAVLNAINEGRHSTKNPLSGNWKWALRTGFATEARGGKLDLTPLGEQELQRLSQAAGIGKQAEASTPEPAQPENAAKPEANVEPPVQVEPETVAPIERDEESATVDVVETPLENNQVGAERSEQDAAEPQVEAVEAPKTSGTERITDFGEKIQGAKKDVIASLRSALGDEITDLASQPLSKVFPAPDYVKLSGEGVENRALAYIALMRDEVPAKPRMKYKVKRWAETVGPLRELASNILNGDITTDQLDQRIKDKYSSLTPLVDTSILIENVDPEHLPFAAKWRVKSGKFSISNGVRSNSPKTTFFLRDDRGRMTDVMGPSLEDITGSALELIAERIAKNSKTGGRRRTKTSIYQDRADSSYFVGFKGAGGVVRLKTDFATATEARGYKDEHADELQIQIDKLRKGPQMRRAENNPRKGPSRRNRDVTPEMFTEAFGFRGVQFGNYVEGGRRQKDLNKAFDALMDMAEIVDIPSQAISLNGRLGLAFGARGSGKASAHFEPAEFVINLTKTSGAGSLAHEWLHALDNYFSKQDAPGKTNYISKQRLREGGAREEVFAAWKSLEKSIGGGDFSKRSAEYDKPRSKPYWNTTIEKAARSFERYVHDRLSESGSENDYLANINVTGGAYPTSEEMETQGIRQAYDDLFAVMETREALEGSIELFSLSALSITDKQSNQLEQSLRERLDSLGLSDVALNIVKSIRMLKDGKAYPADARYTRGLIEIALDASEDHSKLVDHEAIHGLRRMGAFTDQEWKILSRQSQNKWMKRYNIADRYSGFPADIQIEEGIAHAFADNRAVSGIVAKAFKKIRAFFEALRNALSGLGFKSASDIFGDIESGAKANRAPARNGRDDNVAYAMSSKDGDLFQTEIVETIDGPREQSVIPGAGKISTKEQLQRATQGKKKSSKTQKDVGALPLFGDEKDQGSLFALRRDVETTEDRQRAAQGFLARGQLIDRAIRVPFDLFGGLNKYGQWKPGINLSNKVSKTLTESKINPDGHFGWLSGTVETARAGLLDRYGVDQEFVDRERRRSLDERAILSKGAEFLTTLKDQNLSIEEARVLHGVMTGKEVGDADMKKLAEPIRQAIDELGQEAVALGLVSPESYERNRGTYLHRAYLKHETDQDGLSRFVGRMMGQSRKKIIGNQLKGRGIFFEVPEPRLTRDDPEFIEAKRGKVVIGEKFRMLDLVPEQGELLDTEKKPKPIKRIYWPADRDVPLKYQNFKDSGIWEVRAKKGGNLVLWRDYSESERASMGEVLDARYNIGKTYLTMAHDLATGRFYKDVSENDSWTSTLQPDVKWVEASDTSRWRNDSDVEWVKVPSTSIPQTGGKKRWGALAGKWVRASIWRDLNELEIMGKPNAWRRLLTQWKLNKTARSPVVHMNNVMSNMMFMDLADIRTQDLVSGIRSYVTRDGRYHEALENGAFGADMMSQEVRDNVLRPILEDLQKEMQGGTANSFFGRARIVGKIADRIWSWAKTVDSKMIDAYRAEDEIFRMATFMRRRQQGDTASQAADFARQQFLDYDIHAPWVNAARNSVLPFISYTYRAAPLVAQAIATRPWKMAKYFLIAYTLNAMAYGWDDEGDEEKERASLREEETGYTWLGVPRMMRMPFRDQHGLPVFLDIRRWIPAGDIFDTNQGSSAIPIPAPIQFGGPLMMGAELSLNMQAFTGQPITNELTDDWWDKTTKIGDWAWKSWMPSAAWVPGSWYWTKIGRAIDGSTDSRGRAYSVPGAIASSVGIKLKPQDVEQGLFWRFHQMKKIESDLKAQARRFGRQRERNLISEEKFNQEMNRLIEKMSRLNEGRADLADRASPKRTRQLETAQ